MVGCYCFVSSCRNIYKIWLNALEQHNVLSKERLPIKSNTRVCEEHFSPDCYKPGKVKRLYGSAVPSIFTSTSRVPHTDKPNTSLPKKRPLQNVTNTSATKFRAIAPLISHSVSQIHNVAAPAFQTDTVVFRNKVTLDKNSSGTARLDSFALAAPSSNNSEDVLGVRNLDTLPTEIENKELGVADEWMDTTELKEKRVYRRKNKLNLLDLQKKKKVVNRTSYERQCRLARKYKNKYLAERRRNQSLINLLGDEFYHSLQGDKTLQKVIKVVGKLVKGELNKEAQPTFLLDQIRNLDVGKKQVRYSDWTIKLAVMFHGLSPVLYNFMRSEGVLILPSYNTILSYTGSSRGDVGVNELIQRRLNIEAESLQPEEKLVSLQVDEMQLRKGLTYVRARKQFCGMVDFGGVDMNKSSIDENDDDIGEDIQSSDNESENLVTNIPSINMESMTEVAKGTLPLANSLCNFLINGLTKKISCLVGSWPVKSLTAEQLLALTKHVIKCVESAGFVVVRLVCDNAKINVKLFKLLRSAQDCEDYVVSHPVDNRRKLHLSFDPTHLIKNVRNQLIDRPLRIDGEPVEFHMVQRLYDLQKNHNLKPVRYLTLKHVNPTNLERMKVKPAIDIFRPEVVATLEMVLYYKLPGFENAKSLIKFLTTFWKWWEIHDICNSTQHFIQRKENKKPFYALDDERLTWLEEDFTKFLNEWNDNYANPKEFLTKETFEALLLTSKSTASCVRFILDQGVLFVLTRKMTTDELEKYNGWIRYHCGRNDHPGVHSALCAVEKLIRTGLGKASIQCNVPIYPENNDDSAYLRIITHNKQKLQPKRRARDVLKLLGKEILKDLEDFEKPPSVPPRNMQTAVVSLTAGYVLRTLEEKEFCKECIALQYQPPSSGSHSVLIQYQDRGGLIYPTISFTYRLWSVYKFVIKVLEHPEIVKSTQLLPDLVKFLTPHLMKCEDLTCGADTMDIQSHHNEDMLEYALKKFISPLLKNHGEKVSQCNLSPQVTHNKPAKRKVLRFNGR